MKLDRRDLLAQLGGAAVVASMTHEVGADGLEHNVMAAAATPTAARQGSPVSAPASIPAWTVGDKRPSLTVAEIEVQIRTQSRRRGVGSLFTCVAGNVKRVAPMPAKPTL